MKKYVINLRHRTDRLLTFRKNNPTFDGEVFQAFDGSTLTHPTLAQAGFDTDKNWRDPILGRVMTKGEIGCFLSHWELWEKCAEGDEPFMIFEDDVIPTGAVDQPWPESYDFLYLSQAEQLSEGASETTPCYPYHLCAYVITPLAAKCLTKSGAHQQIIP